MSEIKTYPEMNEQIKAILKISNDPHQLYACKRIEELEKKLGLIQEIILENTFQTKSFEECLKCEGVNEDERSLRKL